MVSLILELGHIACCTCGIKHQTIDKEWSIFSCYDVPLLMIHELDSHYYYANIWLDMVVFADEKTMLFANNLGDDFLLLPIPIFCYCIVPFFIIKSEIYSLTSIHQASYIFNTCYCIMELQSLINNIDAQGLLIF